MVSMNNDKIQPMSKGELFALGQDLFQEFGQHGSKPDWYVGWVDGYVYLATALSGPIKVLTPTRANVREAFIDYIQKGEREQASV